MRTWTRRIDRALAAAALGLAVLAPGAAAQSGEDKALNRPSTASSSQVTSQLPAAQTCIPCLPSKANDGNSKTRWGSAFADPQPWWQVDLGTSRSVDAVRLNWELAYASSYRIDVSADGANFMPVAIERIGSDGVRRTKFSALTARFVRVTGLTRARLDKGISLWDAEVYGPADGASGAPISPDAATTGTAGLDAPTPVDATSTSPATDIRLPDTGPSGARAGRLPLLAPFPVVRIRGTLTRTGARIRLLTVRAPRGVRVESRCRGGGCPRAEVVRARGLTRLRALERTFRSGTVIEVLVTRRGRIGKYTRFRVRRGRAPARTDRCASFGARRSRSC